MHNVGLRDAQPNLHLTAAIYRGDNLCHNKPTNLYPAVNVCHNGRINCENPALHIRGIIEALNVLEHNPLIGRPANNDKQELVIGRPTHGYIALYRYIVEIDTVFVLAVRSQQEAGYVLSLNHPFTID